MGLGNVARAVAGMLEGAGIGHVYYVAPSALDCAEPVVVLQGRFEREARLADEERGTSRVEVLVVRDCELAARADADACELALRRADWEPWADCGGCRVCGIDTVAPVRMGRDGSGRAVYGFEVLCTVVRQL